MASDPISALIGGLSDIAVSGLNGLFGAAANSQSYKYSLRLQKQQQEWQERMANTAHQRQVADMRAAGLNPVLSATGGSGAAVPSGSSATINAQPIEVSNPVDSAIKVVRATKELANIEAQTKAAEAQAEKSSAEAARTVEQTKIDKLKSLPIDSAKKVGGPLLGWYYDLFNSERDKPRFIPAPSPAARQRMKEVAKEQKEFEDIIKQVPKKSLVIPRQEFDKLNNQGEYKPDYSKGYVDLKTGYRHLPDGSTVIPVDRQKILKQLKERERKRKK